MDHEEWIDFVLENRESLLERLKSLLPHTKFTNIAPGLYPIIHLQQPHGRVEPNIQAARVGLDDEGRVQEAELLNPSDDDAESQA